jgi:hypothetical protein
MKIYQNKVIKTEPKMIKEGYGLLDLFTTALLIGALIQLAIQLYQNL